MPTYESTQIRVKPFLVGAPRDGHVVIRTVDGPCYLSLTIEEWRVLQRLSDLELTLDAYVKWHLAGREGLSFHEALQLLLRLQKAGFFEEVFSEGVLQRLEELESQGTTRVAAAVNQGLSRARYLLNIPVLRGRDFEPPAILTSIARGILSTEGLLATFALLAVLAYRSHFTWTRALSVVDGPLQNPLSLLVQLSAWFTFAGLLLGALEGILVKTDPRALVPWTLRVCCLFFVRLEVQVEHTLLLAKSAATRHFALTLSLAWLGALGAWWVGIVTGKDTFFVASFAFVCFAAAQVCPFARTTLIRAMESLTGSQQLLATARDYLRRKIFAGFLERNRKGPLARRPLPKSLEYAAHSVAAGSLAWMYVCGLAFLDLFNRSTHRLSWHLFMGPTHIDFWPSLLLLTINVAIVGALAIAFSLILVGNVAAVAQVPLRRARRGLSEFRRSRVSYAEALTQFLKDNPVFSDLPATMLEQLKKSFKSRNYRRGENIVEQGEMGEEFFVLADGEAQVVVENADGSYNILALLHPGDSFGEVALIEGSERTATVRAASKASALVLDRRDFDALFPEGSTLRKTLTQTLRSVKLVQESQALSHLSPRQVREFLALARPIVFKPGQSIVTEGDNAESAYILVSGTAKVCHQGEDKVLARLGAGDLVGMTGIIKATKRNANVIAETEMQALRLDRDDFLRLCMTNIFVAILIANLSENQASQNELKKKRA